MTPGTVAAPVAEATSRGHSPTAVLKGEGAASALWENPGLAKGDLISGLKPAQGSSSSSDSPGNPPTLTAACTIPAGSDPHHRGHLHQSTAEPGLTFADVPSELFQLRPPGPFHDRDDNHNNDNNRNDSSLTTTRHSLNETSPISKPVPNPATPHTAATSSPPTQSPPIPQSSAPASSIQPRKPSPGLAARLKALGFGSSKKSPDLSALTSQDHIGRLPEHQLRQLDRKHQAGSLSAVIERRGRPWKGASAAPVVPSKAIDGAAATPGLETSDGPTQHPVEASRGFLPEINRSEPLEMDTQKYRLPDHTNENGTKVQLETRQEHVGRRIQPPSPDDESDPPPPPPLPKDTPPNQSSAEFPGLDSYFAPSSQRPGSIYTLSRASFANQLAQLTSLQLPDAESLSSKVSAIPVAQTASKALINAAEQIRSWISKASEVIAGLDSEDDVEWAAAGGREGLAEVESAAARFEELINVYVSAIEELQARSDISDVSSQDLTRAVTQMESIIKEWANIRTALGNVKEQVEIAMEWEELWNNVLGDINSELDELCQLVFEMEERRHKSIMAAASGESVDIGDLETIVEDTPPAPPPKAPAQSRVSMPAFPVSPVSPGTPTLSQDDSSLLALFARMQPLRASLDFLPMRLSVFETRAERSFPTACEELEMRRAGLDGTYKKLEKDAEALRKELGEDRWVLVFRGAGRQALKMIESVERSLLKLKESVDAGHHLTSAPAVSKTIENYDAKKTHYGPAIERVLAIIDKGVKDRLTVNGEILRLHSEMQSKWDALKVQSAEMDVILDDFQSDKKGQQLRDSVSSMLSNDRSTIGSGHETPGSSPPSSVIMSSLGFEPITPGSKEAKSRIASGRGDGTQPSPANRRHSSLPAPASQMSRKPLATRTPTTETSALPTPSGSKTPRTVSTLPNRPRWNGSTKTSDAGIGHNFKPMSLTNSSPFAKKTPTPNRSASSLTPSSTSMTPGRSPLNRSSSASPMPDDTPTRPACSRLSFRDRIASPGPYSQQTLARPRLASPASTSTLNNRRSSMQPPQSKSTVAEASQPTRPASSMASGRRSSMLPQPMSKISGRETPQPTEARSYMRSSSSGAAATAKPASNKPRWRH